MVRKITILALCAILISGCGKPEKPIEVKLSAVSAIIIDAKTGEVLYEKNADERLLPASTTKVMTAVVAMERTSFLSVITATNSVTRVEPTVAKLKPGVKYYAKDLMKALLIKSANDAAVAIAEGVSGNERNFVELMNAKAAELGMENTHFANASGLPPNKGESQYTTARDLAKLMRYASKYRFFVRTMAKSKDTICGSDGVKVLLETHNKSLTMADNVSWGKTGYTKKAGRTYVGMDPSYPPKIIFSFLKSEDLENDIFVLKSAGLELYERKHEGVFRKLWRSLFNP